jgi:hypothetical protein
MVRVIPSSVADRRFDPWSSQTKYYEIYIAVSPFSTQHYNRSIIRRTISWQSALLLEETRGPGENQQPVTSHWQTLSHNVVHLALITNIFSFISWRSVLLVEEPGGNHWPVVSHWQTLSHNFVSSTPRLLGIRTHNVSASNYTSIIMLRAKWWNSGFLTHQ